MPNAATIQFDLDAPYDITAIRTYASWDSGRDGQQYTGSYATALNPSTYTTLLAIARFDVTDFPLREDTDWETGDPILVPDENFATTLSNSRRRATFWPGRWCRSGLSSTASKTAARHTVKSR